MRYHFNSVEEHVEVIDSNTGNAVCFCYSTVNAKLICDALNQVEYIPSDARWISLSKQKPYPRQRIIAKKGANTWEGYYSNQVSGEWCKGFDFDEWLPFPD